MSPVLPHCGTQWTTRGDGNSVIRRSSWQLVAQFSRDNSLHRLNGGTHRWISLFHSASWLLLHLENECSELVQKKCSVFLGSPQFNVIEAVDDQFRLESIHQPDCATLIVAIYLNEPQNSARNEKKCYGKILYGTKSAQGVGIGRYSLLEMGSFVARQHPLQSSLSPCIGVRGPPTIDGSSVPADQMAIRPYPESHIRGAGKGHRPTAREVTEITHTHAGGWVRGDMNDVVRHPSR